SPLQNRNLVRFVLQGQCAPGFEYERKPEFFAQNPPHPFSKVLSLCTVFVHGGGFRLFMEAQVCYTVSKPGTGRVFSLK
ncbi:hypothetical protein, partial [uncultured Subdoligranulum sp.]|uniref:hypothetical protein n=1 Tax=uncultured Subdoligranulum sp. TaxID=512298 RepID=UPI002614738D